MCVHLLVRVIVCMWCVHAARELEPANDAHLQERFQATCTFILLKVCACLSVRGCEDDNVCMWCVHAAGAG